MSKTLDLEEVEALVNKYYNVDIHNKRRFSDIIDAKRMFCFYATQNLPYGWCYIAKYLGLTHASIINHSKKAIGFVETQDPIFLRDYYRIFNIDLTPEKEHQEADESSVRLQMLYLDTPENKRKELVDRVSAMVKGYNMTHGADKHEIIYAGVIQSTEN
jgi:hypothetical protein